MPRERGRARGTRGARVGVSSRAVGVVAVGFPRVRRAENKLQVSCDVLLTVNIMRIFNVM